MASFADFDELNQAVVSEGGVLTVSMQQVRDAHGAGRLGVHVRSNISKELASRGLDHFPIELPENQWEPVRIFKNGTPAADLIYAVIKPDARTDKVIRNALNGDAQKTLDKIREFLE